MTQTDRKKKKKKKKVEGGGGWGVGVGGRWECIGAVRGWGWGGVGDDTL